MAGTDDKRSGNRVPLALKIKLRYPDVDTFIDKFAVNISAGGMFIAAKQPKPAGTRVRFALLLADGMSVLAGEGVVRWSRAPDPNEPRRPAGMGIEFTHLDDDSHRLIERISEWRRGKGLPDTDDIPRTPRRRARTADPAPEPPPVHPERRAREGSESKEADSVPVADSVAVPVADSVPVPPVRPERRASEASPESKDASPESKDASPELDELLAGAVDLARALQRARALAADTSDLEGALADLLASGAVPIEVTIEEASAGLAAAVGGAPVVRARKPVTVVPPPPAPPEPIKKTNGESERVRVVTVPAHSSPELQPPPIPPEPPPVPDLPTEPPPSPDPTSELTLDDAISVTDIGDELPPADDEPTRLEDGPLGETAGFNATPLEPDELGDEFSDEVATNVASLPADAITDLDSALAALEDDEFDVDLDDETTGVEDTEAGEKKGFFKRIFGKKNEPS